MSQMLERGRMNGVSPKVAQEILVLFENGYLDSSREQQQPSTIPAGPHFA